MLPCGSSGLAYTTFVAPPTFVAAGAAGGIDWFGTVRARVGFAIDRTLLYATGGLAFGRVSNSWADTEATTIYGKNSSWKAGWTAGGGVEYAFTNNWTAKLEGLYVRLDRGIRARQDDPQLEGGRRRDVLRGLRGGVRTRLGFGWSCENGFGFHLSTKLVHVFRCVQSAITADPAAASGWAPPAPV